jgi:peptidoglycan/xylan/chitin deacetylase (PgdA/CDA1 family)
MQTSSMRPRIDRAVDGRAASDARPAPQRQHGRPVPILEYHNIGDPPAGAEQPSLYVRVARFRRQLRVLQLLGLRGVGVTEAVRHLDEGRGGVVALTFDDAYRDVFLHALPLLLEYGFTATCYVVSARIGSYNTWDAELLRVRKPVMTLDELRQWRDAGMEIGAHTRTHARLTTCSDDVLDDEVRGGKRELQDLLGIDVTQFCYPWGGHDDRVVRAVRAAGFAAAVTTRRGRARPGSDRLRLPRMPVRLHHQLIGFPFRLFTSYDDRPR